MNSGFESFVTRLRQPRSQIDPIYLHGTLTAFACGVEPDMPRFWRDIAGLGGTPPSHSLVDHFYNLVEALEDELDHVEFSPVIEWRGESAPERWIQGVLETIEGQPDAWEALGDEEELDPVPYLEALRRLHDPNRPLPLGGEEGLSLGEVAEPSQAGEVVQRLYLHLYDPEVLLEERRGIHPAHALSALGDEALLEFMREAEYRLGGAAIREGIRRGPPWLELIRQYLEDCGIWEALDGGGDEGDEEEAKDLWLLIHYLFLLAGSPGEAAAETLLHTFQELFSSEGLDPLGYDGLGDYWPALFRHQMARLEQPLWALVEDPGTSTPLKRQALDILLHNREGDELEEAIDRGAHLLEQGRLDLSTRHALAEELLDFPRRRHRKLLSDFFREYRRQHRDCFYDEETLECLLNDETVLPKIADAMQFYSPAMVLARISAAKSAGLLDEERLGLEGDEDWLEDELIEDEDWAEESGAFEAHTPYTRHSPKIGRNDPCPCGSGRKYKRCCMGKDQGA
jgi:hypothetical protein